MTRLAEQTLPPQVLLPFHRDEVLSIAEAALHAGKSARTTREWCMRFDIGRRIAGRWAVSKIALEMLLHDDRDALHRYLAGDRSSSAVTAYFKRLGVPLPRGGGQNSSFGLASENNGYRNQSRRWDRGSLQNAPNCSLARQRGEVAE